MPGVLHDPHNNGKYFPYGSHTLSWSAATLKKTSERPLASTCSLVEPGRSWYHTCRDLFAGLGGAGVFLSGAVRHSWDFIKNEILLLAVDQHRHQFQQMEWQILQIVGAFS